MERCPLIWDSSLGTVQCIHPSGHPLGTRHEGPDPRTFIAVGYEWRRPMNARWLDTMSAYA